MHIRLTWAILNCIIWLMLGEVMALLWFSSGKEEVCHIWATYNYIWLMLGGLMALLWFSFGKGDVGHIWAGKHKLIWATAQLFIWPTSLPKEIC